jgi:hypothetical protein
VGKPERKKPLGRRRNNIKMDLLIHLAQDKDQVRPLANTIVNLRAP